MALQLMLTLIFSIELLACRSESKTVKGTIYGNNEAKLWINGELVAEDPAYGPMRLNAFNVSFEIPDEGAVTFGIEGLDWADHRGLEFDGRCVGSGVIRAIFDNGVATNSSWKCWTYNYGPVNWRPCYALLDIDSSLKVFPGCAMNSSPVLDDCFTRILDIPEGWSTSDFDDSNWQYAVEWDESYVGWLGPPAGCEAPGTYVSTELDPSGENMTCGQNINWSAYGNEGKFIWREDLQLDNHVLCRYTISSAATRTVISSIFFVLLTVFTITALV